MQSPAESSKQPRNAKAQRALLQKVTQRRVYLTLGRWQSICRYFSGRSWRSPPSSLCRRAAAALHQTRSICSQTQSACSACLPRSRPSSKRAASARTTKRAHPREQFFVFCFFLIKDEGDGDEGDLICPSLRDAEARRRRTSWPAANRAGEKWCNARARVPASGPPSPGPRMRAPAEERLYRPTCSSAIYYHKAAVISL